MKSSKKIVYFLSNTIMSHILSVKTCEDKFIITLSESQGVGVLETPSLVNFFVMS